MTQLDKSVGVNELFGGAANLKKIREGLMTPQQRELTHAVEKIAVSRLASLVLQVDVQCAHSDPAKEAEMLASGRARLAAKLGCQSSDLQEVVESYGPQWQEMVLEERVRLGTTAVAVRDLSWDRLETTMLAKLQALADTNQINTLPEILAVAKAANQARRGDRAPQTPSPGNQMNVFLPGNPADGVLPAGHLGRINLSLTPRMVKQIEGQLVPANDRAIDRMQMLSVEDVQRIGDSIDDSARDQEGQRAVDGSTEAESAE